MSSPDQLRCAQANLHLAQSGCRYPRFHFHICDQRLRRRLHTGNTTESGFDLKGGPAFVVFAIIILYFILFTRYLGGTIFQRLLGAR